MVTVVKAHRFLWKLDPVTKIATPQNYVPSKRPRRQDWGGEWIENGAFYLFKVELFRMENCRLGGKMVAYEMDEATLVEIDSPTDWEILENLLAARTKQAAVPNGHTAANGNA